MSPLLFAVTVDILLRRLSKDLNGSTVRAFADDIALITRSWKEEIDKTYSITVAEF